MNPSLDRKVKALDPLEWLARMSDHIRLDLARGGWQVLVDEGARPPVSSPGA